MMLSCEFREQPRAKGTAPAHSSQVLIMVHRPLYPRTLVSRTTNLRASQPVQVDSRPYAVCKSRLMA